jgi:hypothetical protein
MALNVTSVFRVGLDPTNNIVNALLNDGWRFLETAANTPAPTNPLPNALERVGPWTYYAKMANAKATAQGLQGIVANRRESRYRSGRCREWIKDRPPQFGSNGLPFADTPPA